MVAPITSVQFYLLADRSWRTIVPKPRALKGTPRRCKTHSQIPIGGPVPIDGLVGPAGDDRVVVSRNQSANESPCHRLSRVVAHARAVQDAEWGELRRLLTEVEKAVRVEGMWIFKDVRVTMALPQPNGQQPAPWES